MRVLAVDWSGDARVARRIWLAEAAPAGSPLASASSLVALEGGVSRAEIRERLVALGRDEAVVGLDFAFSFPAWFLRDLRIGAAIDLWERAAADGETWLTACVPPFWGQPGRPRPALDSARPPWRRTELEVPRTAGIAPKSVFQIGGAGAVGTGSIRGMPLLRDLYVAGASVWPFVRAGWPLVVEIYPRLLTGPVRKSNPAARSAFLSQRYPDLPARYTELAVASEDAFDAAVSALVMAEHVDELCALPADVDPVTRLEGRIWHPPYH